MKILSATVPAVPLVVIFLNSCGRINTDLKIGQLETDPQINHFSAVSTD